MNKNIEELLNEHNYPLSDYYLFNKKDIDLLLSYIEQLQTTAKDCKQKLDQYENPDDLTLFYMWLDEKAKDKMKQLEKENEFLKLDNPSANMKHFEMLKENKRKIDNLRYQNKQLKNNRDKAIEILTYKQNAFNTCFSVCDVIDILGDKK